MKFQVPCEPCRIEWERMVSERPGFSGRAELWCRHERVSAVLRIDAGRVTGWTLASCGAETAFLAQRQFLAAAEKGVQAAALAEAAIESAAAGGATH